LSQTNAKFKRFNIVLRLLKILVFCLINTAIFVDVSCQSAPLKNNITEMNNENFEVQKTDVEWKSQLSDFEYEVLRNKATERPYTSAELFESKTKFDAGCGWPSFYQSIDKKAVKEILDTSHGMVRTEVVCAKCGGHLGHVFNDGYGQPTGLRYCINGISLGFKKKEK
jgi:peptide-methionine (R)-S-oxide reductase